MSIVGVSKPVRAFTLAQSNTASEEFSVAEKSLQDAAASRPVLETTDEDVIAKAEINPESGLNNNDAAKGELADAANITSDVEGSGEINSDLDDSGSVNPEVENSGEINSDLNDSGSVNPEVENSGEINSDLDDSGSVKPEVENSGEPLVLDNLETRKLAALVGVSATQVRADDRTVISQSAIAQNNETIPNNDVLAPETESTTATKSKWWLWLIPLLGISLLAAIFALGGKKKSDQEPAIGNIPQPDAPNGGLNTLGTSGGNKSVAVDANPSNNLGNVARNTAVPAVGAAVAGGAAANLLGRKNQTANETDLNLDLDVRESDVASEIPVNPVSEFSDQEMQLQFGEQSTKLQSDIDNDFNLDLAQFKNDSVENNNTFANSTVLDEVVATPDSLQDSDAFSNDITLDSIAERDRIVTSELDLDSVAKTDSDESTSNIGREFRGDFVLDEETRNTLPSADNISRNEYLNETTYENSTIVSDLTAEPRTPELELNNLDLDEDTNREIVNDTAQVEAEATTADFVELQQDVSPSVEEEFASTTNIALDASEEDSLIDLDLSETPESTSATVSELTGEFTTPAIELNNLDLDEDTNREIVDDTAQVEAENTTADFVEPQQDLSQLVDEEFASTTNIALDASEEDSLIDLDLSETPESTSATVSELTGEFTTPAIELNNLDLDLDEDTNREVADNAASSFVEGEQNAKLSFDLDLDAASEVDSAEIDLSLAEITLEEGDNLSDLTLDEITFDDTDDSINASFEEITFEDTENSSIDDLELLTDTQNISLDNLKFDEPESSLSSELLSSSNAEITSLSDDQSNDLNNISEWLDSLDTPNQSTDDITEWLDSLDTDDNESAQEEQAQDMTMDLEAEADDISFKFLEDLLERDSHNS
ncbi:MAG: hypothetical protein AAGE84_09625 [Cyanobacteria bacterium P01_G01_bin.39]